MQRGKTSRMSARNSCDAYSLPMPTLLLLQLLLSGTEAYMSYFDEGAFAPYYYTDKDYTGMHDI
jgi:hypothetical protein